MAEIILLTSTLAIVIGNSIYQFYRSRKLQTAIKHQNMIISALEKRMNIVRQECNQNEVRKEVNQNETTEEIEESAYGPYGTYGTLPENDNEIRKNTQQTTKYSSISEKPYAEIHITDSKKSLRSRDPSPRQRARSRSNSNSDKVIDMMIIDSRHTSPHGSHVKHHSSNSGPNKGVFIPQLETIESKRGELLPTLLQSSRSGSRIVRKHKTEHTESTKHTSPRSE